MIELFVAAFIAGIVLGAPVGPAGAMVADAALANDKKRLRMTIFAAVAADSLRAFVISFAAIPVTNFLKEHEKFFNIASGVAIILLGMYMGITALVSKGELPDIKEKDPGKGKFFGAAVPSLSIFLIALFHPGSIAAFLFVTALFSMKITAFSEHRMVFVTGIAAGSLAVFSLAGALFWRIREKADKSVHYFRYGIATVICLAGVYLLIK